MHLATELRVYRVSLSCFNVQFGLNITWANQDVEKGVRSFIKTTPGGSAYIYQNV